jgi:mono/diheme cytochrome c family protein
MRRAAVLGLFAALGACDAAPSGAQAALELIQANGCAACHVIPGVPGADGRTGPPLTAMADQAYVAGVAPNTREWLALFIADPQRVDPRSAMPDLGVSEAEALLIADWLYEATR